MSVVMINEHREDALKVTRDEDQQPIEALGTNGPNESFRDLVRLRRLNRRAYNANARALKHVIEASRKFAIVRGPADEPVPSARRGSTLADVPAA
jgi:hypothetical protein